ncbi:MAG: acetate--CoA ligase family protein [Spirochaetaceae bacterium]|jgi:acetyltransferase|nr:acetate--CoA ligase family protein [Spirochaetaceae bacterium]
MGLDAFFNPRGVAVIGSAGEGKIANVMLRRLIESGMENVYAINPKAQGLGSIAGFPSAAAVGRDIDLAVIASPSSSVVSVMEDCGKAGVKAAIVISSGFSEAGNLKGEEDVYAAAKRYGIRFIGPNCAGLVNTHTNLVTTLEVCPRPGSIALVSQSGAVGGLFMSIAESEKTGISKFVSYGNGADVNSTELLAYLGDDTETSVIALYIESIKNGREFMRVLRSVTPVKPVIVIKAGRTSSGQRATLSHTGSMAGSDAVFDAALSQCGAIRAETLEELFDMAKGFAAVYGRDCGLPGDRRFAGDQQFPGNRIAIVTNSGGPGVMTADKADELGLKADETPEGAKEALRSFLPPHAGIHNPVDLTVEGTGEDYKKSLAALLEVYDGAVAVYVGTPYLKSLPIAQGISGAAEKSGKPVFTVFDVGSDLEESRELLAASHIPNYASGERAAAALNALYRYGILHTKPGSSKPDLPLAPPEGIPSRGSAGANAAAERITGAGTESITGAGQAGGVLPEPEAMRLLNSIGVPSPVFKTAASAEEAARLAGEIGFPVAIKVVSPRIIHKSDSGGVVLNVKDAEDAVKAFQHLEGIAAGKIFNGVIIYPMVKVDREVIMGITKDNTFGPVVAFGLGGIYTEILKDVVFRVAPIDTDTAEEMIRSIRSFGILSGSRGKGPVNIEKLASILSNFSALPLKYTEVVEGDINPLSVSAEAVYALDARIVVEGDGP